ncbi:MAG: hypothetical protein MUF54_10475, partial [Polyangiaceae bacterium]|nr:hypothetical protein [Polyangiaceae bacterium]
AMAGLKLSLLFSKGTLVITQNRVTRRVVNRLRKPSNADIIVPGGTVSVLGTTSVRIDTLDDISPTVAEVDTILDESCAMVPELVSTRIIRAYAGVRPLVRQGDDADDRSVSRDLALIDHGPQGVENLVTITGGKLTTYRYMAEKAADLVCGHLGVCAPCRTRQVALADSSLWTVPALAPRVWLDRADTSDLLLCECEMVPQSVVDEIVAQAFPERRVVALTDVGLRSRVGKGACQGGFCSLRVLAHLVERDAVHGAEGVARLKAFLNERWKGERCILFGTQLCQAELKEALHCALLGLEL